MKIKDLRPRVNDKPVQCTVTAEEMQLPYNVANNDYHKKRAKRTGKDLRRCMKQSKYLIDGRHYCALHAGGLALAYLLKKGQ